MVVALAKKFRVSRPTVYKVIERARKQEFSPRKSTNKRFLQAKYRIKRLAKVESSLEIKKKLAARRYNKSYPGEMVHFDTKRLPLLKGEVKTLPRDYLFIGIDDFSRKNCMLRFFLIRHKILRPFFLSRLSRNALTRLNAPILIMARNIKEPRIMLLLSFAKPIVLLKNLREFGILKLMERLNA